MELTDVIAAVRVDLSHAVVAVDFDGTLAPLVDDPSRSAPLPGAVAALAHLARQGCQVAVITGRDALTAVRLGGFEVIDRVVVEGLYGAESWQDGTLRTPDAPPVLDRVRADLPAVLSGADPSVWVEDKRLSLVVHVRLAADPAAQLALLYPGVEALAGATGMEVHRGHHVLELRLPGPDKAAALRRVTRPGALTVYIGDDVGDLPAFAEIHRLRSAGEHAYAVGVRSSGVDGVLEVVDVVVDSPAEVLTLLEAFGK